MRPWSTSAAVVVTCLFGTSACGRAEISILTYNVAGLPEGLSASNPAKNTSRISPLLNDYDIVLVQEDFAFHADLSSGAFHAYRAPEGTTSFNGSGLARFSNLSMQGYRQSAWRFCHGTEADGSDCLASKGLSWAEHEVELEGSAVSIQIYNIHMDAGDAPDDEQARVGQAHQLADALAQSAARAVIVAGDTNEDLPGQGPLEVLAQRAGLVDVCAALECPRPQLLDRVLYRSSPFITLEPLRWRVPEGFVDEANEPLSDHLPVAVDFAVTLNSPYD